MSEERTPILETRKLGITFKQLPYHLRVAP